MNGKKWVSALTGYVVPFLILLCVIVAFFALTIIGISSIHLLKSFINAGSYEVQVLMWQTIIHVVFLLSALAIAYTDKLTSSSHHH